MPSRLCGHPGESSEESSSIQRVGYDQLMAILLVGGEVIGSQHHQPSDSSWSGVYVLMGSIKLTSFTWRGFQCLQNTSKDMTQYFLQSLRKN